MKTSLAVQRSTVGDSERRAPSRLREQCSLLAGHGSEGAKVGGRLRLSLGGNVGHVLAIFLVRFSTADSSRAFSDAAGVTFPPLFPSILLLLHLLIYSPLPPPPTLPPPLPPAFNQLQLLTSLSHSHTAGLKVTLKYTQLLSFSGKWTLLLSKPLHDPNTLEPGSHVRVCARACVNRRPPAGEGNEECSCCSHPNCHNCLIATSGELDRLLFDP